MNGGSRERYGKSEDASFIAVWRLGGIWPRHAGLRGANKAPKGMLGFNLAMEHSTPPHGVADDDSYVLIRRVETAGQQQDAVICNRNRSYASISLSIHLLVSGLF